MTRRSTRLQTVGLSSSQPVTGKKIKQKKKFQNVETETEQQERENFWKAVEDPDDVPFFEFVANMKKKTGKSDKAKNQLKENYTSKVEEIKAASAPALNLLEEVRKLLKDSDGVSEDESIEKLRKIMESSNGNTSTVVGGKDICADDAETENFNDEQASRPNDKDGAFCDENNEEDALSDPVKNSASKSVASQETIGQSSSSLKRKRGPTKCNSTLLQTVEKVHVEFNGLGQPIGEGSVSLSSFVGPLVREIVPYSIEDWRKVPDSIKNILWAAIQEKYQLDQLWQKEFIMKEMGELWRASKSRLVTKVREAQTVQEQLALKPINIKSTEDWKQFIKLKTSERFKAKSNKFRELRNMQFPHTSSRRGYARLTEDMKINSSDPSDVKRDKVWIKAHTKKNGDPVNTAAAETIAKLKTMEEDDSVTNSSSVVDDSLAKVLGPEKRGRIRALGKGVSLTKLQILQQNQSYQNHLEDNIKHLQDTVAKLSDLVGTLMNNQGQKQNAEPTQPDDQAMVEDQQEQRKSKKQNGSTENRATENRGSLENSTHNVHSSTSVNSSRLNKPCKLLEWAGQCSTEVVAEGRWSTNDPTALVHHVPLGPNAVRVWVDVAVKRDTHLWRPTSDLTFIEDAVGTTIAWPYNKILMA